MKKLITFAALALLTHSSYAILITQNFTGSFTTGSLSGQTINAFIEIDDMGLISGTADTNPLTIGDGSFDDLGFTFSGGIFFDLFDDLEPLATFSNQTFVGLDYFGTNLDGEQLDVFYDAFAEDAASGINLIFDDGSGNLSTGTLNLPTAVPEPSTYGLIFGMLALGFSIMRRRKA